MLCMRLRWTSMPELTARDGGPLGQRAELGPYDIRVHAARADVNTEAAIDTGHDVVAADELRIPFDSLGDELRMLDVVGLGLDDAGYQHLAIRQLHGLEQHPFVPVPRVCRFELHGMRFRPPHDIDDVLQRHVEVV